MPMRVKKIGSHSVLKKLIIVTNREPFQITQRQGHSVVEKTTGGVISALVPAMQTYNGVWISSFTQGSKKLSELKNQKFLRQLPYDWTAVRIPKDEYYSFYYEFSNRIIWPLYHSMPSHIMHYKKDQWSSYKQANKLFAEHIAEHCDKQDFVWIHDYQLSLVPEILRNKSAKASRIGYFLHIPFPSYYLFRTLPWARDILKGMLGANIIGFHVDAYCRHFFDCVEELLNIRCDRMRGNIMYKGRQIHVRAIPIGIDAQSIYRIVETDRLQVQAEKLRKDVGVRSLIIGIDRLDYTKGIPTRLEAFEKFLLENPHRHGEVAMIQVVIPSRTLIDEYQTLRDEIEKSVGQINSIFGRPGWTPVTYLCRSLSFAELVKLYYAADLALITPLRDGMNMIAKEFVAAHVKRPGVLILSELAGAALELTEALLVNPYDVEGIAKLIEVALQMPIQEQKQRFAMLNTKIAQYDVHDWVHTFLSEGLHAD